jgi:hypothetical protein
MGIFARVNRFLFDRRMPFLHHNRYRDDAPLPGFFWLFAIGELVSKSEVYT